MFQDLSPIATLSSPALRTKKIVCGDSAQYKPVADMVYSVIYSVGITLHFFLLYFPQGLE